MTAYVIRRVLTGMIILVLLSMFTFLLFNALPADPAALTCGKSCNPQVIEANRERLGLDMPLYMQYLEFVKGIFFGRTYGSGTADLRVQRAVPGLLLPPRRGGHAADPRACCPSPSSWRSAPSSSGSSPASCSASTRRCVAASWQERGHHGWRARRLLVPLVLHRPAAALLHRDQVAAASVPELRAADREPRAVLPDDDPAVDHAGAGLRGLLHPAHAQPDARDAGRGLHPHRAGEGPAGADRHRQARTPRRPHPDRHGRRARPGRPARWRDHHRERVHAARARPARHQLGARRRPAGDHRPSCSSPASSSSSRTSSSTCCTRSSTRG